MYCTLFSCVSSCTQIAFQLALLVELLEKKRRKYIRLCLLSMSDQYFTHWSKWQSSCSFSWCRPYRMVKVIRILVIICQIQLKENPLCFMRCAVTTGILVLNVSSQVISYVLFTALKCWTKNMRTLCWFLAWKYRKKLYF